MDQDSFIKRLRQKLPYCSETPILGIGDDCAAVAIDDQTLMLLAVDQLIGGRHYFDHNSRPGKKTAPPELAGRKLLARNLSDIAAMGGTPTYCLTAVSLAEKSARDPENWLERFFNGLLELAAEFEVQLIGGDLAVSSTDDIGSLTIVGIVPAAEMLRRGGAAPGDALFATGCFGDNLESEHHLYFQPRCREGRWLAQNQLARAAIDVSDGLLLDALRLARASEVSITLDLENIPRRNPEMPLLDAISEGEDYELLFAVPAAEAERLTVDWPFPVPLTRIGRFHDCQPPTVIDLEGRDLTKTNKLGHEHCWPE